MALPPGGSSGGSDGGGSPPGEPRTALVRLRLTCADPEQFRTRYPELQRARFTIRTKEVRPPGTRVRLEASWADGTPCFQAAAVLERVVDGPPAGWVLALAAMDDRGCQLVIELGGKPPPVLDPKAATGAWPIPSSGTTGTRPLPHGAPAAAPPVDPRPVAAPVPPPAAGAPRPVAAPVTAPVAASPAPTPGPPAAARPPPPPASELEPLLPGTPPPDPAFAADEDVEELEPLLPETSLPPARGAADRGTEREPAPAPRGPERRLGGRPSAQKAPPPRLSSPPAATPVPEENPEAEEAPQGAPRRDGPIIGIDLGTTNTAVAVVKNGKPFIVPSREGYNTIPSVVALSEKGTLVVGHVAKGRLLTNPANTVHGAKRLIGRQFTSPAVSDLKGRVSYEIVPGPRGEAAVRLGERTYSLQKISAMVLSQVKELAEQWLGEPVGRAVITVPAYYNDNQRQAVRAAGALAGLQVERIVNEPTAAAISFAQGRRLEKRVLVYDLGGGTFDTSLLELHGNVYEVVGTGGDTFLGGVDFDKALVDDLLARFQAEHGVSLSGDRVVYQRITDAAERAKVALSERLTAQVDVPFVTVVGSQAYSLKATVTRAELEQLTRALVERTLLVCKEVLDSCGVKPSEVGEVLLVGGQSRMPLVRAMIREVFGREPAKSVHPDEAVAQGAALLAASLQSADIEGMVLVDVLPMSIGVGLTGGRFKKVIEKNTRLPHKKVHSIWASGDRQSTLTIPIFQGESDLAQENEYLGTLLVADLPPGVRGEAVFDVVFTISPESILTVSAEERGTARTVSATFSTQDTPEVVRRRLGGLPPGPEVGARAAATRARPSLWGRMLGRLGLRRGAPSAG